MTTRSNKLEEMQAKFRALAENRSEEELIEQDALILMAAYLSEIERIQYVQNINRKQLAEKIGTSASYLTQVFRGDKPLNFSTLAKIKKALRVRFEVKARPQHEVSFRSDAGQHQAIVKEGNFTGIKRQAKHREFKISVGGSTTETKGKIA